MQSIFTGEDTSELFPKPRRSAGMCSTPECSAFSPTLRGEAAFPFPPTVTGPLLLCLVPRRAGRIVVSLGESLEQQRAGTREQKAFLSEIPTSNYFFPPVGSGQREVGPDCPPCAESPRAGEEGLEAGGGSCPG